MTARISRLKPLQGDQAVAANPRIHAALSASAGTGKTQVLTARVLRLLLSGVAPSSILCLTFTKAGAAEMANRIGARLAAWVRIKDAELATDLDAIGAHPGPGTREVARQLFARVLDAPGGLRIQTIHSFAQTLLASFPAEAGVAPGFQPIEGRAEQELARTTLASLLADAENDDRQLIADVQCLSLRLGEQGATDYLMDCARASEAMEKLGARTEIEPKLRAAMSLPTEDADAYLATHCADDRFDCDLLRAIADANRGWGTATGAGVVENVERWLAMGPTERAQALGDLALIVFTGSGDLRKVQAGLRKVAPGYDRHAEDLAEVISELLRVQSGARLARDMAAGLRAGQAFAAAYTQAKRSAGVADFNDLIGWTRALLSKPGMGDWVRYKLDQRTDHILIDESQDTNRQQWEIIEALAAEYFSGAGASERQRTIFMVGDFKQAIFGFQGTDPNEFNRARQWVRENASALEDADDNVVPLRRPPEFKDLSIDASFRSAPAVLEAVDAVIREVGYREMGLPDHPNRHAAFFNARPGSVEVWKPFETDAEGDEEGEEGWLDESERLYAGALAAQVKQWLDEAPVLASTKRPLSAGDILVLVRSRGELASLIVARLFAEGVPVAGIDRLHLQKPLAVQDLIAAVAFAVQPLDDLALANLLVSPLVGWTQEQLAELAIGRTGPLWTALGAKAGEKPFFAEARAQLNELLRMADYTTPHLFLETILSGPVQGRRKLYARLGMAARDPIEELLSSALEFERGETPSLDRFLAWFSRGNVEVKRDPSAPGNAVRVMTVHGSKGLEAPFVIIADATSDPAKLGGVSRTIEFEMGGARTPLIKPRKAERLHPFDDIISGLEARDLQEHWRLLYVGMTRAIERLVVAGVQPSKERVENCWHMRVERALQALGSVPEPDERWGQVVRYSGSIPAKRVAPKEVKSDLPNLPVPDWAHRAAPVESRPPRPLAPSAMTEDREVSEPPGAALKAAARRGTLIHQLFERLPEVPSELRMERAVIWLQRSAGIEDEGEAAAIAAQVCAILSDSRHASLFGPGSLGEAPIAATLADGRVLAGTIDRLLVEPGRVSVIDFKTGRVPSDEAAIPAAHRRQMEAYVEALRIIFPDRAVRAALLYTAEAKLIELAA